MGEIIEKLLGNLGAQALLGMLRDYDQRAAWLAGGAVLVWALVYPVWHKVRFGTWYRDARAEKKPSRAE